MNIVKQRDLIFFFSVNIFRLILESPLGKDDLQFVEIRAAPFLCERDNDASPFPMISF